jgi:molybdopterin-guanine dinucleotide biosynthesis protein A
MKDRLEQFLASGHRKALDWIQYTDAMITDFSGDAATFANINTEDDAQSITASINNHV